MAQPTIRQEPKMIPKKSIIVIRYILFLILIFVAYRFVNYVLRDKTECNLTATFNYEKNNSLDVVFLGSSQIVTSVYPMELWNDYGIASYNMAASGVTIPLQYYMAETVFERQTPKVIVADVGFVYVPDLLFSNPRFHAVYDNFDFSPSKYRAIKALVAKEDYIEMIFPLHIYHTRWNSLTEADFKPLTDFGTKGAALLGTDKRVYISKYSYQISDDRQEITKAADDYLHRLINLCEKNGTKLVLTAIPICEFSTVSGYTSMLNSVQDIADEHGLPFLNGYRDETHWGLDYNTDFIDTAHTNIRGGEKVTDYLGKFLSTNFDLPDRRNDENYSDWFETYKEYKEYYDSIAVYPTYDPQVGISFVSDGYNASSFFVNGIHGCENSWSWSSGKQSDAFFLYNNTDTNKLTFSLDYVMLYSYNLPYQEVEIYINDVCLGSLQLTEPSGTVSVDIPEGLVKTDNINHLCIKYPQIIEDTEDGALAVAYKHIYIK